MSRLLDFWQHWKRCLLQHIVLGIVAYLLYLFFFWTKEGLPAGHQINRSWADASMVFLFVSLMIGPLSRLWPWFNSLVPWRRDIGLWFGFTAIIHIGLLAERHKWNVLRFFADQDGQLLKAAAHASNWVGLAALAITLVLMLTSNRISLKLLGASPWKFIQQSVYTVFFLASLHTFIFVFQVDSRKSEAFRKVFWIGITLVFVFQLLGLIYTVRRKRLQERSRKTAPYVS